MRSMPNLPGAVRARGIAAKDVTAGTCSEQNIRQGMKNASWFQGAFFTIGAGCAAVTDGSLHDNSNRPAQIMPTNRMT